jgi:hypothetical protein
MEDRLEYQQRILRLGNIARNKADLVSSPGPLAPRFSYSLVSYMLYFMGPADIQPQKPNTRKWSPSSTTD